LDDAHRRGKPHGGQLEQFFDRLHLALFQSQAARFQHAKNLIDAPAQPRKMYNLADV